MTEFSVAEKITGKSAQEYIPIEKREENIIVHERDPEVLRSRVFGWIKAHPGLELRNAEVAIELNVPKMTLIKYLRQLETRGKIRRAGGIGTGERYARYYPSTLEAPEELASTPLPVAAHRKHGDGPVFVRRQAAPIASSTLVTIEAEAWNFVKLQTEKDSRELGNIMKTVKEFVDHLGGLTPAAQPPVAAPAGTGAHRRGAQ